MPRRLIDGLVADAAVLTQIRELGTACQPRLLVVADGRLDFSDGDFGLSRFIEAIEDYWVPLSITLAHRDRPLHSVTIAGKTYLVQGRLPSAPPDPPGFVFDGPNFDVSIEHFDQIWLFGFSDRPLGEGEIRKIAAFMNAGGGVFATGDHGTLGSGMGANLPRIRHMRDWSSIPMGTEFGARARDRIDTVINPGANGRYEFIDQSDDVPQRIYPNSNVVFFADGAWAASIHPVLRLPGAQFHSKDIFRFGHEVDVLPDHPHESVCVEISARANAGLLNSRFNRAGLGFREFPPSFLGDRILGSDIVAYGVSAGRALEFDTNAFKPPVNPRMFGVISAFDGHPAFVIGDLHPGRILCDSTWHHFVNINIDGGRTGRSGLGTGSGASWVPSEACEKIYAYYRNTIAWLQPAARRTCPLLIVAVVLRFHAELVEELFDCPTPDEPARIAAIGADAVRLVDGERGRGAAAEIVHAVLRLDPGTRALADAPDAEALWADAEASAAIAAHALGRAVAYVASSFPEAGAPAAGEYREEEAHERLEQALMAEAVAGVREAMARQIERCEARLKRFVSLAGDTADPIKAYAPDTDACFLVDEAG